MSNETDTRCPFKSTLNQPVPAENPRTGPGDRLQAKRINTETAQSLKFTPYQFMKIWRSPSCTHNLHFLVPLLNTWPKHIIVNNHDYNRKENERSLKHTVHLHGKSERIQHMYTCHTCRKEKRSLNHQNHTIRLLFRTKKTPQKTNQQRSINLSLFTSNLKVGCESHIGCHHISLGVCIYIYI